MGREVRSPAEPTLAPAVVHEALAGAGAPLPAELLALTQAELGFDASKVRVHTDALAAASARAVRAVAYTVGRHIAFAAGAYAPATTRGRELLRHELQHAAQQGDGGVPGVGGLVVASEGDDERTAEAAERGGFTRARGLRSVRLQRKPEAPQPAVATESLYAEVRAALELADGRRAVLALRRLPAGAGLKLARREPGLRARLAASTQFYPKERVVGLALLAGAKADDWHVRVAAEFVNFRHDGARALLAATGSTGDARALEADFGRDLGDALPGRPTVIAALSGGIGRGLDLGVVRGVITGFTATLLRAWMRLDHDETDVERAGLGLAEYGPGWLVRQLREVSRGGRDPQALAGFRDRWEQHVRRLAGWKRPELALQQGWCVLGLEEAVEQLVPGGPREQVATYFAALHEFEAARAELADFDRQVQAGGRVDALERVAKGLRRQLQGAIVVSALQASDGATEEVLAAILARLGLWRAADLKALDEVYARLHDRSLAQTLRRQSVRSDDTLALLGLLTTQARYGLHVRVAQALFRREPEEAHQVLYGLPDAARPRMYADYQACFAGLRADDATATVYVHAAALLGSARQWKREKALALLDALLTPAEELYFNTLPLSSANQNDAKAILEKVRGEGRAAFRQLHDDWGTRIRGPRAWLGRALADLDLRTALQGQLKGSALEASETLFVEFADALTGGPPAAAVKVGDLEPALRSLERAVFAGKPAAVKREVTHVAALVKQLRASDKAGKYAGEIAAADRRLRRYLDTQAGVGNLDPSLRDDALVLYGNEGTRSDADEIYRQWQLRPSVGSNEDAATAILVVVTRRWLAGTIAALEREAQAPTLDAATGAVLRKPYSLADLKVFYYLLNGRERAIYDRIEFTRKAEKTPANLARRLHMELSSYAGAPAERVGGAFAFLGALSATDLAATLKAYAESHDPYGVGPPAERFIDHLIDRFSLAKEVLQIADIVREAPTSAAEVATRGRLLEAGRHTALLGALAGWLAGTFGGRDVRPAIEQAVHNLEAMARDERQQAGVLAATAAAAGRASGVELAKAQYEDLKSYVAVEQQLIAEVTTWVQFSIEVGMRAALVAVFGPAGVAGLLIGVGTVAGGRLAAKGLQGANNQLLSRSNIADLATELTGPLYEFAKLEESVGRLVNGVVGGTYKRQVLTSALTKVSTASIDGIIERAIKQNGGPDFDKQAGVTAGAFAEGIGKVLGDRITFNVGSLTSFNERWLKQTLKQFLAGPPPKASTLASGIAEVVKYAREYQLKGKDEVDFDEVKKRARAWLLNNFLTGSLVGASFAANKSRVAGQRVKQIEADPAAFAELLGEHPLFKEVLRSLPPDQQGAKALALWRDRDLLRKPIDARDPATAHLGEETQAREIDRIAVLASKPEGVTDRSRAQASGAAAAAKAVVEQQAARAKALAEQQEARAKAVAEQKAARVRTFARELERASVPPGLRQRSRGAQSEPASESRRLPPRTSEALPRRRATDEE